MRCTEIPAEQVRQGHYFQTKDRLWRTATNTVVRKNGDIVIFTATSDYTFYPGETVNVRVEGK